MGDAQRSDCHRAGQLRDLGARTACRQRRAQRRQKHDCKQQRRIARSRGQRSPALTQHIAPELLQQWTWMRGICDGQRTEGNAEQVQWRTQIESLIDKGLAA